MIKKINLILMAIGISLTINYHFGYIMVLPIVLFYLQKNVKMLFYILPAALITTLIWNKDQIIPFVIIMVLVCTLYYLSKQFLSKTNKILISILILIITNSVYFLITHSSFKIIYLILLIFISICIWLFLFFEDYLYLNNILKYQTIYTEQIIVIIAVAGAATINISNIQLGFILAAYFAVYYAKSYHNIYSLMLGIVLFLIEYLGFGVNEGILILLISAFYIFDYNYLFIITNIILMVLLLTSELFIDEYLFVLMFILVIFEILWTFFIKKNQLKPMTNELMHNLKINTITAEYQTFAMFLDYFITTFKHTKEYQEQMKKAIECITSRHCNCCNIQKECYQKNQHQLIYEFSSLIEENKASTIFKNNCQSYNELSKTASMLSKQIRPKSNSTNEILLAVLNETKQVLQKYQEDIENKPILTFDEIKNFHTAMYESTFKIKDIIYHKIFKDDLNIEIILTKNTFDNIEDLTSFVTSLFHFPVTITHQATETEEHYTILLKEKFHIEYGYGSLSSKQNELCGDNYLIKTYNNGHFLAAISDGMGNGYQAYEDSKIVLDALDSLSFCSTSFKTNIEILNLLYILQGYTERYSTIDAIDINRSNYEAYIYKLGATSSYIFHEDYTYTKIENKCLPLGIEEEIVKQAITLKNNDLILLTSDGIFENLLEESQLLELINNIKNDNPQKIVYEILEYMLHTKVKVKDDMSIIILKLSSIN